MKNGSVKLCAAWVRTMGLALVAVLGFGLAAYAADGEIVLEGYKYVGPYAKEPRGSDTGVYGKFFAGNPMSFNVRAMVDGRPGFIQIWDTPENLVKVPKTYKFYGEKGDPATAKAEFNVLIKGAFAICPIRAGTVTVTSFGGAVGGVVTGTLDKLRWNDEQCKKLGEKGSFKVQRSVDSF